MGSGDGWREYTEQGKTTQARLRNCIHSWATPMQDDANNVTRDSGKMASLARDTHRWATPTVVQPGGTAEAFLERKRKHNESHDRTMGESLTDLGMQATKWATPRAEDGERGQNSQHDGLMEEVRDWATPTVCGNYNRKGTSPSSGDGLATETRNWATPTEQDSSNNAGPSQFDRNSDPLNVEAVKFTDGRTPPPAKEQTVPSASSRKKPLKRGLNPRFALWLMGFPTDWLDE